MGVCVSFPAANLGCLWSCYVSKELGHIYIKSAPKKHGNKVKYVQEQGVVLEKWSELSLKSGPSCP
jgi:hypothetical protein